MSVSRYTMERLQVELERLSQSRLNLHDAFFQQNDKIAQAVNGFVTMGFWQRMKWFFTGKA